MRYLFQKFGTIQTRQGVAAPPAESPPDPINCTWVNSIETAGSAGKKGVVPAVFAVDGATTKKRRPVATVRERRTKKPFCASFARKGCLSQTKLRTIHRLRQVTLLQVQCQAGFFREAPTEGVPRPMFLCRL